MNNSGDVSADTSDTPRPPGHVLGRRRFFRTGATAAAGAVAAVALPRTPAAANQGLPVLAGQTNTATAATSIDASGATGDVDGLVGRGSGSYSGVVGNGGADGGTGVIGFGSGAEGTGVRGISAGAVDDPTLGGSGVYGSGKRVGVYGKGAYAGMVASGDTGLAAYGIGHDVKADWSGRFYQKPMETVGPPLRTQTIQVVGEQMRDRNGDLWLCVSDGFPGVWRRATAAAPGFGPTSGSLNLLSSPFRLIGPSWAGGSLRNDSILRPGAANALRLQVTETAPPAGSDTQAVPSGAVGVLGTVSVLGTTGRGYLAIHAESSPAPAIATVSWSGANQAFTTSFISRLSATGTLAITNGSSSTPTYLTIDIVGFVY